MNLKPNRKPRRRRSDAFLEVLRHYAEVVVLMHDNPDPDAIATGWAIKYLVEKRLDKSSRLLGGGAIERAENRYLVQRLEPPLELTDELALSPGTAVVLVDCGAQATNHLACSHGMHEIVAVIDHHETDGAIPTLPYQDVRPNVAASATIAATYLREQNVPPHARLATALLYALRSETRGNQTYYSPTDRAILPWLTRLADPQMLAEIEDAPLPRAYYGDLVLALQSTFTYDDAAFCLLPRATGAEIVGEVADLLIRCEEIDRVFCGAAVGGDIIVSVRTSAERETANDLVQRTLAGLGRGGGHTRRAGGKIPGRAGGQHITEELQEQLRRRWLEACGIPVQRGRRLIRRGEIVENLS